MTGVSATPEPGNLTYLQRARERSVVKVSSAPSESSMPESEARALAEQYFKNNPLKDSYSIGGFSFKALPVSERYPETAEVLKAIKEDPSSWVLEYYDDGTIKEAKSSPKTYVKKYYSKNDQWKDTYSARVYDFSKSGLLTKIRKYSPAKTKTSYGYKNSIELFEERTFVDGRMSRVENWQSRLRTVDKTKKSVSEFYAVKGTGEEKKLVVVDASGQTVRNTLNPAELPGATQFLKERAKAQEKAQKAANIAYIEKAKTQTTVSNIWKPSPGNSRTEYYGQDMKLVGYESPSQQQSVLVGQETPAAMPGGYEGVQFVSRAAAANSLNVQGSGGNKAAAFAYNVLDAPRTLSTRVSWKAEEAGGLKEYAKQTTAKAVRIIAGPTIIGPSKLILATRARPEEFAFKELVRAASGQELETPQLVKDTDVQSTIAVSAFALMPASAATSIYWGSVAYETGKFVKNPGVEEASTLTALVAPAVAMKVVQKIPTFDKVSEKTLSWIEKTRKAENKIYSDRYLKEYYDLYGWKAKTGTGSQTTLSGARVTPEQVKFYNLKVDQQTVARYPLRDEQGTFIGYEYIRAGKPKNEIVDMRGYPEGYPEAMSYMRTQAKNEPATGKLLSGDKFVTRPLEFGRETGSTKIYYSPYRKAIYEGTAYDWATVQTIAREQGVINVPFELIPEKPYIQPFGERFTEWIPAEKQTTLPTSRIFRSIETKPFIEKPAATQQKALNIYSKKKYDEALNALTKNDVTTIDWSSQARGQQQAVTQIQEAKAVKDFGVSTAAPEPSYYQETVILRPESVAEPRASVRSGGVFSFSAPERVASESLGLSQEVWRVEKPALGLFSEGRVSQERLTVQAPESITLQSPVVAVAPQTLNKTRTVQYSSTWQDQVLRTEQVSQSSIKASVFSSSKPAILTDTPLPPQQKIVGTPFSPQKADVSSFLQGFDVFVRRRGVFQKETSKPLSRQEALNLGASIVGSSAAATFKLEKSQPTSSMGRFLGRGVLSDFTTKKGLYIEKPSRRIKSLGEKREITQKGLAVLKFKGWRR